MKKVKKEITPEDQNTPDITKPVIELIPKTTAEEFEADIMQKPEILSKPKLTVCIPYLKSDAQGNELLFAVRSLQKNLREDFQLVVIGDSEEWFSDEVIHIPAHKFSDNPQIDTLEKLKLAIADERVSDCFIWSNDDIYLVSPVMLADIQILTAHGKLKHIDGTNKHYEINRNDTITAINLFGNGICPIHNYDTHTPICYEKEKLVELFEEIPSLNDEGLLLPSIYFNLIYGDHIPQQIDNINGHYLLRVVSPKPNRDDFIRFVNGKKFLNNSETGYSDLLIEFLETKFSEPSRFEN